MSDILLQHADGPLLTVILNEPERANPLSPEMATVLTAALEDAAVDSDIRAVILTGAGKHFSAGADLAALEGLLDGGAIVSAPDLNSRRDIWARAYVATPHGHPVLLSAGQD